MFLGVYLGILCDRWGWYNIGLGGWFGWVLV